MVRRAQQQPGSRRPNRWLLAGLAAAVVVIYAITIVAQLVQQRG